MDEQKPSEIISAFLKLVNQSCKEYDTAFQIVNEQDKELQDLLHIAELENLNQNQRAKLTTQISKNRKERRYWKDKVDLYGSLVTYLEDKDVKRAIELLKQVLGNVRKAENYLDNRNYKPRVLKEGKKND